MASNAPATEIVRAVDAWFDALNAMLRGDPEPFAMVFSHGDDVLYMSGEGTYRVGWEATWADWKEQARKNLGGVTRPHDVRTIVSGDVATVALVAHSTLTAPGGAKREVHIRQTSAFRRENGAWKMFVHHADSLPVWEEIVGRK